MFLGHMQHAVQDILLGLRPPQLRCPATPDPLRQADPIQVSRPYLLCRRSPTGSAVLLTYRQVGVFTIERSHRCTQGAFDIGLGKIGAVLGVPTAPTGLLPSSSIAASIGLYFQHARRSVDSSVLCLLSGPARLFCPERTYCIGIG